MARNFSFLKSKRFWGLIVVSTVGLFAIVFFLLTQRTKENTSLPKGYVDSIPPISQITDPQEETTLGKSFRVSVRDVDAGGSGVAGDRCSYSVYDCGSSSCTQTVSSAQRTCGKPFLVSVGESKECFSQGKDACRIIVKSQDLAGNKNVQSEAQKSIRTIGVDLVPPNIAMEQPSLERTILKTSFDALITDNVEVSNCDVLIGGKSQYGLVPLQFSAFSCAQQEEKTCYKVSGSHVFSVPGTYDLSLACWDLAGNTGRSKTYKIEAIQNRVPQISSCRVLPAIGTLATVFLFQGEASDPDGDALIHEWEFGDGTTASGEEVYHQYKAPGTYTPLVKVTDSYGAKENCFTAWVVVEVGGILK